MRKINFLQAKRWQKFSTEELADAIGCSVTTVRKMETFKVMPSFVTAVRYALAVGLTYEELIRWAEEIEQRIRKNK